MPNCFRDLQLDQRTPFIADGARLPGLRDLGPVKQIPCGIGDSRLRVRVVKDVLRCGQWKVGVDDKGQPIFWTVTPDTLRDLANSFRAMQAAGNTVNLCYGHGDPETRTVDPRDLIAPLDAVLVKGDRLWVASYVTPEQARDLSNPAMQVSVRTVPSYRDGGGRTYGETLLHVAVVDLPVVDGQHPFLDLSNVFDLANGDAAMADDTETTETTSGVGAMDAGQIDMWKRAFALLGLTMPEDVTPENAPIVVETLLSTAEAGAGDDDEANEDPPGGTPADDTGYTDPDGMPAMLANALKPMQEEIRDLKNQLAERAKADKRDAYAAKLRDLATAGNINAAQRTQLEKQGEKLGYDLSVLSTFELAKAVDLGKGSARKAATPAAPSVTGGDTKRPEGDDIQAGVNALHKGFGAK